tara:strand:+ start:2246 stop:4660 length:2415 start_codon:yes stop_codon:yes gene_type:complete
VLEPAHAVDSIVVTSLEDDGTEGTLRWAITESNAGLTFDKITFSVSGTINLASSLPGITRNVTIEGPGEANLAIDGGDLYSGLVLQGRNMTIGGLTFSNMYNSNGQAGSAIWLVRGTVYVNNVTVTSSTTAIATKEGGSYIYINYGTFTGNTTALFSNHGGTPTTPSEDDNAYDNRIHVSNSLFESNNTAVYGERTILIDSSAFNNNSTAFLMRGLNKHRVTNSTFDGNGNAVNVGSWWPNFPGYLSAPYLNTVITGNTFTDNELAINLSATHNNIKTQVGANISNNIWDEAGTFIISYEGSSAFITDGLDAREGAEYYAINNTSSVPPPPEPSISAPTNLSVTVNQDGSVSLTWDASVVNETAYLNYYVIAWNIPGAGWAITTTNTYGAISASNFESTGGFDIEYSFKIRADDNDNAIYVWSESVDNVMVSVTGPSEEELAQAEADRLAAEEQAAADQAAADQAAADQQAADDQAVADQQAAEQAEADRQAAAQAESDRQAAADAEAARQAAIKAEADRQAAIKAAEEEAARQKAIADAKAEADRIAAEKAAAEEVARLEAVAKAKADAAAALAVVQAKAKADAEAKAKADAAAKAEADRIALAKAEADAKAKATADAKAKADALAKAEEDARIKAELDAKLKVEEEAKEEGKVAVELKQPLEAKEVKRVVEEISKIEEPRNLTNNQVAQITQVVNEVFASVEKDSEEYDAAREILAVLAEADDKELPKELAAIPILGNVAGEVLNVLNDLGNVGSDMAPEQRERSEETVVAAVIVGQVAQVATATAAAASAGASGGYRRRIK